ncbi:MAG TPA: hypothetical protein VHO01_02220 [Jatrophihabitans sp.]|nr:hypothetical protein [Jatrophihabitans sp.]
MLSFTEPIVAVRLSCGGRTGITLYAPPWEDTDGEQWQGFLGDGAKIVLLGTADELNTWLGDNPEHDLADHPAWPAFAKRGKKVLEPAEDADYDFEAVYELAAGEASEESVDELADIVDLAGRIADCCEDGKLRVLLGRTREYALLVERELDYTDGKDGQAEWSQLGDVVADSWERAVDRIESWLSWQGTAAAVVDDTGADTESHDDSH